MHKNKLKYTIAEDSNRWLSEKGDFYFRKDVSSYKFKISN